MFSKLLLISVALITTSIANAQTPQQRLAVSFSAGLSSPVGKFAETTSNILQTTRGNAMNGMATQLSIRYDIKERWGIALSGGTSTNKQDQERILKNFLSSYSGDFELYELESQRWNIYKLMPGLYYTLPLSKSGKLAVEPAVYAGIAFTRSPKTTLRYIGVLNPIDPSAGVYTTEEKRFSAFSYQLETSFRYTISKQFDLLCSFNYFNTASGNAQEDESLKRDFRITFFNTLLGIRARLFNSSH